MGMFLPRNGHEIDAPVDEQEQIFLGVSAGTIGREPFTERIEAHVARGRA